MIDLKLLGGLTVARADAPPETAVPRRRTLALLALVAAGAPQPITRDKVLALLWPESDSTRAGNSLRQTIFSLRRDLNEDLFLPESRGGLQLDCSHITVDLWRFRDAIARNALTEAADAYGGPFLDGFFIPGLSTFSQWVESERDRLERAHLDAISSLAKQAESEGRHDDAVAWRRRHAAVDPLNARSALGLLKALTAAGDRAGALKHAAAHGRLIRKELEIEPEPVVTEFVDSLRRDDAVVAARRLSGEAHLAVEPPASQATTLVVTTTDHNTPLVDTLAAAHTRKRFTKRAVFAAALGFVVVTAMAGKWLVDATAASPPIVILGSGTQVVAGRDPTNRLMACDGPACPAGSLPQDAYVVAAHGSYAPPAAGTAYIAPVPDATTAAPPGYKCCTTATFENAFRLPADAISATISIATFADNQAIVAMNGVEFGRQGNKPTDGNFAGEPSRFSTTFAPDPSGTNRLRVTLWDGGGALGLQYVATVTYETRATRRGDTAASKK